jgi:glycosyltransferase involved in cell wall biosynthesis
VRLIAIPLGEISADQLDKALARHFGAHELTLLDRHDLRRQPSQTLATLIHRRYDAAVLVAPDLRQRRLRVTSLILGLAPAAQRWRIDLAGNRDSFSVAGHLATNGLPIVRHVVACALALILGEPLLHFIHAYGGRRRWPRPTNRPTRLLYLRSQLWLGLEGGGSVAHTAGVIGALERAGVEVQVVSSDRLAGVAASTDVVAPETWFDGWPREVEELAYNVAFFFAALRAARRTRPAAIYQRHTAFNCVGAVLTNLLRIPFVLEYNSSELWKGRYWGGLRLVRLAALVERINLVAADRVVVVSRVLRDQLAAAGTPPGKILVNPNAVDVAQFHPKVDGAPVRQRLGISAADIVVGFCGTFGLWHGIPTLADVLPRVVAARPNVRWLLIGDGPLRSVVDDVVRAHSLEQQVRRSGMVPHEAMPGFLAACDLLVSPHGRQLDGGEFFGSPTKLFEYMAAGRAIVASAVGQIAEVLRNEETALLVPPDDPDALCSAIVRLVDDACLRDRLARAARADAEARHTWRHNAERVLDALQQS